jgi:HK97 family phage portal protein
VKTTFLQRTKQSLQSRLQSLVGLSSGSIWGSLIHESFAGAWQQNVVLDFRTVLANPTLYACVTLIAGDIAKLCPMLVEEDEHGIWNEIDDLAPYSAVLDEPNDYQDRIQFFQWWMLSKLIHGNTYVLKQRDGRGLVRALYVLDPARVWPLVAPDGSVFYSLANDILAEVPDEGVVVPAREIIHDVMFPLFHPLCGISPLYAAGSSALYGLQIRQASGTFFGNGSRPGGVLTAPGQISQPNADRLKAYFESEFTGNNSGKIAVLSDGMKFDPMAMTAEQSQLIDQLRATGEDICAAYHMPRHKVGVGPDPTFNNIGVLNQQYYTDCLQTHITTLNRLLTKGLGLDLVPGREVAVEFDLDDLQLMDTGSRIEAGTKAIVGGMSPNEVRARFFDLGPVEGGDEPFLQKQNWPLQLLGSDQPQPTPAVMAPAATPVTPEPADLAPGEVETASADLLRKALAA